MVSPFVDHYSVLELDAGASAGAIKQAYHRLALKHHTDKNFGSLSAKETFQKIVGAWEILSDPTRKEIYDYTYALHQGTTKSSAGHTTPDFQAPAREKRRKAPNSNWHDWFGDNDFAGADASKSQDNHAGDKPGTGREQSRSDNSHQGQEQGFRATPQAGPSTPRANFTSGEAGFGIPTNEPDHSDDWMHDWEHQANINRLRLNISYHNNRIHILQSVIKKTEGELMDLDREAEKCKNGVDSTRLTDVKTRRKAKMNNLRAWSSELKTVTRDRDQCFKDIKRLENMKEAKEKKARYWEQAFQAEARRREVRQKEMREEEMRRRKARAETERKWQEQQEAWRQRDAERRRKQQEAKASRSTKEKVEEEVEEAVAHDDQENQVPRPHQESSQAWIIEPGLKAEEIPAGSHERRGWISEGFSVFKRFVRAPLGAVNAANSQQNLR